MGGNPYSVSEFTNCYRCFCFILICTHLIVMKRFILSVIVSLIVICGFAQVPASHDIAIKLTPYQNCYVYLASHYGKDNMMADTAWLNEKSEGHFRGHKALTGGLYILVSPQRKMLFEFLLDSNQRFSITADTSDIANFIITGSAENYIFRQFSRAGTSHAKRAAELTQRSATASSPADFIKTRNEIADGEKQMQFLQNAITGKYTTSLLATLLNAGMLPELPEGTVIKTKADTLAAYQYIKAHFWDDVAFNDDRLLYIPMFATKLDLYFSSYVSPAADSVIKEMDHILMYARSGKEIYPYLLMKFANQYYNSEHIGQNKVLIHLFDEYFMRGDTVLLDEQSKRAIFERAYQMMANRVGDPAPPLNMTDVTGKKISLNSVQAAYTMVVFWDPTCSHCKEQVPGIDSLYKAKWKALGMSLYSVNINPGLMKEMAQFAKDKKLSADWIFTCQPEAEAKAIAEKGQAGYHQLYDVYETPTIYLLDKDKHIIAKRLGLEQFDAVLTAHAKAQAGAQH